MPPIRRAAAAAAVLALSGTALGAYLPSADLPPLTWSAALPASPGAEVGEGTDAAVRLAESAFGRSGKLRAVVVDASASLELPLEWTGVDPHHAAYQWEPVAGTRLRFLPGENPLSYGLHAPASAGVWRLRLREGAWTQPVTELAVITRVPFSEKRGGYLNGYRIGNWPTENSGRTDQYAPPAGFIEVTPENQDLHVSENFRLRNFLTKDQFNVWPKYLALDLRLIDKLELVLQELNAMGVRADHMAVMSGFRTPAYNAPGSNPGRAVLSRHTFGDAADVWVDNDRDGYMDDLNGDGRRDHQDALLMLRAVERVERRFPELTGGAGIYRANGVRGPFIHIDVRGYVSRW
jgi:hypothetical protein